MGSLMGAIKDRDREPDYIGARMDREMQTKTQVEIGGGKKDKGKMRMDLIPAEMIEGLAKVFTMGADKYADRNWERGIKYGRIYAATMRHLQAFWRGEDHDEESGLLHLWHAMWGCGVLAYYVYTRRYQHFDDRPYPNVVEPFVTMSKEEDDAIGNTRERNPGAPEANEYRSASGVIVQTRKAY